MSTDSFNTNYFIALFSGGLHWSAGRSWRRCHSLSKLIDLLLDLWQRLCLQIFLQPLHMIPTDILPMEYGGTNGCLEELAKFWKKEVEASQDWLKLQVQNISILYLTFLKKDPITQWRPILNDSLHQTTYKSEENLRRGRPKLHADLFGIEGSFRKLDIDWSGFYWFSLFGGFSITYLKYDTGSERWLFTTFILFWLNTRFLKILVLFISNFINHI